MIILIYIIHDAGNTHFFLKNFNFVDPVKGGGVKKTTQIVPFIHALKLISE